MNPKEGLRTLARNPWIQRGAIIAPLLFGSACARPEKGMELSVATVPPGATATAPARTGEPQKIPSASEESVEKEWKTFTSLIYPYRIDYPNNWIAKGNQIVNDKKVDIFLGEVVDGFTTNYTISVETVPEWVSLYEYALQEIQDLVPKGFVTSEPRPITFLGRPAFSLNYTIPATLFNPRVQVYALLFQPKPRTKSMNDKKEIVAFRASHSITVTPDKDPYPIFQKTLSTFQLLQ